ncbi:MAG: hypothetical protein KatS3mg035_2231 [Bacteroidia bacterium]|nr:MAG: hypothetical protein KatS3mg035_2231 [Bacteroidia bacterium]
MNKLKKYKIKMILLILSIIGLANLLYSQTIYIFRDDSLLKTKYLGGFENSLNQPYIITPFFDLKERLPDGEYIVVNVNRKDSAKKDLNKYIEIKGQYKDSLRNGRFEYYRTFKINGKWKNKLTDIYTYKRGLLDGYYVSMSSLYKLYEGYYKDGKRHGIFITYDFRSGEMEEICVYIEDTLKYRVEFKEGEMQPIEIDPQIFENKIYDTGKMPMRKNSY